jgi:hypothetical protein
LTSLLIELIDPTKENAAQFLLSGVSLAGTN